MSIRLFNIDFGQSGSVVCAITTVVLIGIAIAAVLQLAAYIFSQISSIF